MVDYMDNQIRSLSFLDELKQHDCILNIPICKLADVIEVHLLFPQLQDSKYVIRLSRLQMKNNASKWYKVGIKLTRNYRRAWAV